MGRARLPGSVWAVAPWLLALLGALLLSQELYPLSPPKPDIDATPASEAPKAEPQHKEEIVFQPWEHVST